MSQVKIK